MKLGENMNISNICNPSKFQVSIFYRSQDNHVSPILSLTDERTDGRFSNHKVASLKIDHNIHKSETQQTEKYGIMIL